MTTECYALSLRIAADVLFGAPTAATRTILPSAESLTLRRDDAGQHVTPLVNTTQPLRRLSLFDGIALHITFIVTR